jgi:hypothetical protein
MPTVLALETQRCVAIHDVRALTPFDVLARQAAQLANVIIFANLSTPCATDVPISTDRLPELSRCESLPVIYSSYAMTWTAILANAVLMLECMFAVQRRRYSKFE